jgi:hypothetical protein
MDPYQVQCIGSGSCRHSENLLFEPGRLFQPYNHHEDTKASYRTARIDFYLGLADLDFFQLFGE